MSEAELVPLREKIVQALRTCFDPEIPVNIYDLGLIYDLTLQPSGEAYVKMTLTAPNCPVAGVLPGKVEQTVRSVPGVADVRLELVFEPPWSRAMMTDAAKLQLGFDIVPMDRLKL
jgi:FeS assembly SUF system protein